MGTHLQDSLIYNLKLTIMKTFLKSAFFINLIIVLTFGFVTWLCYICNLDGANCPTMFFGIVTLIFLMILPACSTEK